MNRSPSHHNKIITGHRPLPEDFRPSINEFIIGRGKRCNEHCGNQHFRDYIDSLIPEYLGLEHNTTISSIKTAKTQIIYRVLEHMKKQSPQTGGFVKYDSKNKRWLAVSEATARITISQSFRDAHSSTYKSSKQSKQQRRQKYKFSGPCSSINAQQVMTHNFMSFGPLSMHDDQGQTNFDFPNFHLQDGPKTIVSVPQDKSNNKELDLDSLFCNLRVQNMRDENPFEPTPIAPGAAEQIATSALLLPQQFSGIGTKDTRWDSQIQRQTLYSTLWRKERPHTGMSGSCGHSQLGFGQP